MSGDPLVDIVIALHDPRRRLDRALDSLADERARVTVVCHGITTSDVAERASAARPDRVRFLEFSDGVRSPSGPFNHGLRQATGTYVMIMGSDDFLEPAALTTWIDAIESSGADIQLAPLRHQDGALLLNPLTRPWRRHRMDVVRDRLFHRTAPLGLIRRSLVPAEGPLTEGFPVGGDLAWSSAVWASGSRVDIDFRHPAYVIGADADTRVTTQPRPVGQVLAPVDALLAGRWAVHQPDRVRASLVAKLVRVNVIGTLTARPRADDWPSSARDALRRTLADLERYSSRGFDDLPRGARKLLEAAAAASASDEDIAAAVARYRSSGLIDRTLPRRITRAFGRESTLRRYGRYALERQRR